MLTDRKVFPKPGFAVTSLLIPVCNQYKRAARTAQEEDSLKPAIMVVFSRYTVI